MAAAHKIGVRTLAKIGTKWKLTQALAVYKARAGCSFKSQADALELDVSIPAGEVVEVMSKANPYGVVWGGMWFDVRVVSTNQTYNVQFKDFNQGPVLLDAPQALPVYLLRDTSTGKWYREVDKATGALVGVDTFAKAKKFPQLAGVRAHMLVAQGYYHGIPGGRDLPHWMTRPAVLAWPTTMEIVEVDKISLKETRIWSSQDTAERMAQAWRLRELTVRFGPSVRAMYKKLEDKNQLGEYPFVVVWSIPEEERDGETEVEPAELSAMKSIVQAMDQEQVVFLKSGPSACLACINEGTAWAATQLYQGALRPHVISLGALLECVPTETLVEQTRKQTAPKTIELPDLQF